MTKPNAAPGAHSDAGGTRQAEASIAVEQKGARRGPSPAADDRGASVIHQGPQDPHPDAVRKA